MRRSPPWVEAPKGRGQKTVDSRHEGEARRGRDSRHERWRTPQAGGSRLIRVAVAGAAGRMGSTTCAAVDAADDLELVGRADPALDSIQPGDRIALSWDETSPLLLGEAAPAPTDGEQEES